MSPSARLTNSSQYLLTPPQINTTTLIENVPDCSRSRDQAEPPASWQAPSNEPGYKVGLKTPNKEPGFAHVFHQK